MKSCASPDRGDLAENKSSPRRDGPVLADSAGPGHRRWTLPPACEGPSPISNAPTQVHGPAADVRSKSAVLPPYEPLQSPFAGERPDRGRQLLHACRPIPHGLRPAVIIVSALARQGAEATLEALELGAFDCIAKQLSYDSVDVIKIQSELVGKIKAAAGPRLLAPRLSNRLHRPALHPVHHTPATTATVPSIIAIATSTGGPKALEGVLSTLPADLPAAILIEQHMPIGFARPFAKRLSDLCKLKVHEAEEGNLVTAGHVYLAPAGKHFTVRRRSSSDVFLQLSALPSNLPHIPSANVMMSSVAEVFGASAMGIIMTGMGDDGALGMQAIFREGGLTLGQDQATCVVYGMPRFCAEMGVLHQVASLSDIPLHILAALRYRKPH